MDSISTAPIAPSNTTSPNQQQEQLIRTFGALHAYDDEDHLFVISPDRLGFGVLGDPMSGFDPQAMEGLNALLNLHWPTGALIQFTLYKSPDIEETLYDYQQMRTGQSDPLLRQMCDARVDFMRELTRRPIGQVAGARLGQVRLLITVQIPHGAKEPTREELLELRELRNTFASTLKNLGLYAQPLTPALYIRVMESMLNHGQEATWRQSPWSKYDNGQLICNQILDSDTAIDTDWKQLHLGEAAKVRVLSVKRWPEHMFPGMSMRFLADLMKGAKALRDPTIVTVNVIYPDHESVRGKLEKDLAWTTRQVDGAMAKYVPA